ncbi:Armadillo-type fold [Pseudocohnilembus persalinus]|uniref:Armadillo-type fold n=1 Tax=Pseudocohnilembus persalinus TaxID=266149 RepID=A0A0V0QJI8_PSEPJ|nr:Armadillo-type fold [Pseudocohnilembus persalinus]|eukprot:KRX02370.1 Armadillo-type fold [Pseudocohnilembus persalinus]
MWLRRFSCVTFVTQARNSYIKNFEGFTDLMFEIVKETVQYDERFNQLASGWLLRNLFINNRERAIKFIEQNYSQFSRRAQQKADPKVALQQNAYLKNIELNRGLKSPEQNLIFKEIWNQYKTQLSTDEKKSLANILLQEKYFEDKKCGVYILKEIISELEISDMEKIKNYIKEGHAQTWASIDLISSALLQNWTFQCQEKTQYIASWRFEKENLWVRRCSCVSFVNLAKKLDSENFIGFTDLMFETVEENLQYNERFNQLAAGWLIRNLSIKNKQRAIQFIEQNYSQFSREGLRYAIEKLDSQNYKRLLNFKGNDSELNIQKDSSQINQIENNDKTDKKYQIQTRNRGSTIIMKEQQLNFIYEQTKKPKKVKKQNS